MKKYKQLTDELKQKIIEIEDAAEKLCDKVMKEYQSKVSKNGCEMDICFERDFGWESKRAAKGQCFEKNYASRIWLGISEGNNEENQDHLFILIWECKTFLFQKYGYLHEENMEECELEIKEFITEFIEEVLEERKGF